ncbi:hypothetical protein PQ077_01775 [Litorivicinus sp.]|nr:hypothetical protein [Litorivicinus sp.]
MEDELATRYSTVDRQKLTGFEPLLAVLLNIGKNADKSGLLEWGEKRFNLWLDFYVANLLQIIESRKDACIDCYDLMDSQCKIFDSEILRLQELAHEIDSLDLDSNDGSFLDERAIQAIESRDNRYLYAVDEALRVISEYLNSHFSNPSMDAYLLINLLQALCIKNIEQWYEPGYEIGKGATQGFLRQQLEQKQTLDKQLSSLNYWKAIPRSFFASLIWGGLAFIGSEIFQLVSREIAIIVPIVMFFLALAVTLAQIRTRKAFFSSQTYSDYREFIERICNADYKRSTFLRKTQSEEPLSLGILRKEFDEIKPLLDGSLEGVNQYRSEIPDAVHILFQRLEEQNKTVI